MALLNILVSKENKFQFCAVMLKAAFCDNVSAPLYGNIEFSGKKQLLRRFGMVLHSCRMEFAVCV